MVLTKQYKPVLVFHKEAFQLIGFWVSRTYRKCNIIMLHKQNWSLSHCLNGNKLILAPITMGLLTKAHFTVIFSFVIQIN